MTDHLTYFKYLQKRSLLGGLYRKYWLYPKIARRVDGEVLDIGCGIGDFLSFYGNAVGADVNPHTVEWCRDLGYKVSQIENGRLPFAESSFACVLLDNVIEHIEDPSFLLEEIYRVMRHDGVFIVGVPGKKGFASDPDHKVFYSLEELKETVMLKPFQFEGSFASPFGWTRLGDFLRQFAIYGIFRAVKSYSEIDKGSNDS